MSRYLLVGLLTLTAAGLVGGVALSAEDTAKDKTKPVGDRAKRAGERLGLTEDQKARIQDLIAEVKAGAAKATDWKELKAAFHGVREKFRAILTEEQKAKIQQWRENHPEMKDKIRERVRERLRNWREKHGAAKPAAK
jgi:Spy/CpxP family protein refolding chaperone